MSLIGLRADATHSFECSFDPAKGTEKATVFVVGTLSPRIQVFLRDQATRFKPDPDNDDKVIAEFSPNAAAFETVRFGLKGWTNFNDDGGNSLLFATTKKSLGGREYDVVSEETMDFIHADIIREISEELGSINSLTETESKNSEG